MAEMEFLWEAKGHEKLVKGLNDSPRRIALHLNRVLRKVGKILIPYLQSKTPVGATHHLRNAPFTHFVIHPVAGGQRLVIKQSATSKKGFPYGVAVREGTRPHWPPSSQEGKFVSVLLPWINAVLGISGKRADSVAYLIGRKMSRVGTQPNPYHKDLISANRSAIQAIVDDEGVNIWGELSGKAGQ